MDGHGAARFEKGERKRGLGGEAHELRGLIAPTVLSCGFSPSGNGNGHALFSRQSSLEEGAEAAEEGEGKQLLEGGTPQ